MHVIDLTTAVLGRCLAAGALALCATAGAHESFAPALARVLPQTVGVYVLRDDGARPVLDLDAGRIEARPLSPQVGAGILIGDGHFVTAAHVVAQARRVVVKLADARVLQAQVVGSDEEADIALLRLERAPRLPEPPAWGRSASLRPGDWVVAVGEPFGLGRSVAAGIVGAKDRHFADDTDVLYIQSDVALNPGNSGGPLADAGGAIVAMNLRTVAGPYGATGVSLSVPIEIVLQIARELRSGGGAARPRLGLEFCDLTPFEALDHGRLHGDGALVSAVHKGGIGERMGVRENDIVIALNGRAIASSADLARALLAWREAVGTRLVVVRDGRPVELVMRPDGAPRAGAGAMEAMP
jgi:serine protease Do